MGGKEGGSALLFASDFTLVTSRVEFWNGADACGRRAWAFKSRRRPLPRRHPRDGDGGHTWGNEGCGWKAY